MRFAALLIVLVVWNAPIAAAEPFRLAPAVAVEAEDFAIDSGWTVVRNGRGNYMVDTVGTSHISGEALLGLRASDTSGAARREVIVPEAGAYRLWVRYEYPPHTEARFKAVVEQHGRVVAEKLLGSRDNDRILFDQVKPQPQYDPPWGPEGMAEESLDLTLESGPAVIRLLGVEQPQTSGVAANRNVDLVYLTRDTADAWRAHYRASHNTICTILDAFRDTVGPRLEVRVTNRGDKPSAYNAKHHLNRTPWWGDPGIPAALLAPGESTPWTPIRDHDTAHFSPLWFHASGGNEFELDFRISGEQRILKTLASRQGKACVYLPPYPLRWDEGDVPCTPIEKIDAALKLLAETPTIGKVPTRPLVFGGATPLGDADDWGRKYVELHKAVGLRAVDAYTRGDLRVAVKQLADIGVTVGKTFGYMNYRNFPTPEAVAKARAELEKNGMLPHLGYWSYGDEVHFFEWVNACAAERARNEGNADAPPAEALLPMWREWLKRERPGHTPEDYWRPSWGTLDPAKLRPDSTAETARERPRLYADSVAFYAQTAVGYAAVCNARIKAEFGAHVLGGAAYSAHPYFYPLVDSYITLFRRGGADLARHNDYLWQVAQLSPMTNGYLTEHFNAAKRVNPRVEIRQYVMPHSPGARNESILRTAFTHLAHGATSLDFWVLGMNEYFSENYIDHRDPSRYVAIREVTHALGFVEDLLPESRTVSSGVALVVSESTEPWDFAAIADDAARHDLFGPNFRKMRLTYHQERVGLWTALTHLGATPDLLLEADLTPEVLKPYHVVFLVGDSIPAGVLPALDAWVREGGVVFASSGVGRFGRYREENRELTRFLSVARRSAYEERAWFLRPRQELAFLKPLATIRGTREAWEMPTLATWERIAPAAGARALAEFGDGSPAVIETRRGKGRVVYAAALPGLAYQWTALQPPAVPDRGPSSHSVPQGWDPGVREMLGITLRGAGVVPIIDAGGALLDARLLRSGRHYLVPIANYRHPVGEGVTLKLRVPGTVAAVRSAYGGELPHERLGERWVVTLPRLGYGDVLRVEMAEPH